MGCHLKTLLILNLTACPEEMITFPRFAVKMYEQHLWAPALGW